MRNVTAVPISIAKLIDNYARLIEERDKLLQQRNDCAEMLGTILKRLDLEPRDAVFPNSAMRDDIRSLIARL
jgi:hypothetical protein